MNIIRTGERKGVRTRETGGEKRKPFGPHDMLIYLILLPFTLVSEAASSFHPQVVVCSLGFECCTNGRRAVRLPVCSHTINISNRNTWPFSTAHSYSQQCSFEGRLYFNTLSTRSTKSTRYSEYAKCTILGVRKVLDTRSTRSARYSEYEKYSILGVRRSMKYQYRVGFLLHLLQV